MIRHLARRPTPAQAYYDQLVSFGGLTVTLGEAVQQMMREGHDSQTIDAWVVGALHAKRLQEGGSCHE